MAGTSVGTELQGPRLAYVVRKIKGTIEREVHTPATKDAAEAGDLGNVVTIKTIDAGYMVYTPTGRAYRLSEKELRKRGFHKDPEILNVDAAKNKKTAAGRFMLAINEKTRKEAWIEMEEEVIAVCHRKTGSTENMVFGLNNMGKVNKNADAA